MARPPSSALLSVLAVLATTSIGSPTPPPFLCPCLNYNKRDMSYTQPPPPPTPTPPRVPNKFIQCDDGLWRRVESYTLYGSTLPCPSCPPLPDEAYFPDDPVEPPPSTSIDDIRDSLPLGWKSASQPNERHPNLSLALSLVLACLICAFIVGYVFWRKKIIKRRKKDLEAEFKKHHSVPSLVEEAKNMVDKESKAKLKIWARATARWKANVRHAARQRRGKWVTSSKSSQVHQPSNNSLSRASPSLPSPIASRRSSLSDEPPQLIIGDCLPSLPRDTTSIPTITPHANAAISPPAYHIDGQSIPINYSNISHVTSLDRMSSSFTAGIDPRNYGHTAHVATDDKTMLARLADLASRPPEEFSTDMLNACDTLVSAPAWHDQLEEIPPDLITSNDHPHNTSSLFPPPPSKERMATADLYDYSFSFQDAAALEPEPSAPPFHLGSASLDELQILPSAPPLMDDTELLHPSAPQFDVGEQTPAGQDHDRMSLAFRSPSATHFSPASASQEDIITLPGYRP